MKTMLILMYLQFIIVQISSRKIRRGGGKEVAFGRESNNRSANSRKQKHEHTPFTRGSRNCARARDEKKKAK